MDTRALAAAVALFACSGVSPARCPATGGPDLAACDARPDRASIARCLADARSSESCADHARGLPHVVYLARAASELTKAGIASGARTAAARRWLAHAMVLDERVQDDPTAPRALRTLARSNEDRARKALFH